MNEGKNTLRTDLNTSELSMINTDIIRYSYEYLLVYGADES